MTAVRAAIIWIVSLLTGLLWTMNLPRKGYNGKTQKMIPIIGIKREKTDFFVDFPEERSGSVVECLPRDQGAAGSSLTGVFVLCPGPEQDTLVLA